jgi:hypothetical protein
LYIVYRPSEHLAAGFMATSNLRRLQLAAGTDQTCPTIYIECAQSADIQDSAATPATIGPRSPIAKVHEDIARHAIAPCFAKTRGRGRQEQHFQASQVSRGTVAVAAQLWGLAVVQSATSDVHRARLTNERHESTNRKCHHTGRWGLIWSKRADARSGALILASQFAARHSSD